MNEPKTKLRWKKDRLMFIAGAALGIIITVLMVLLIDILPQV